MLMKELYFQLIEKYPEYFKNESENGILIYTKAKDILNVEKKLGKEIGVMYQDKYIILLRDAVRFPNGKDGSYIRVLPADSESPVVVLPVVNGKILLMSHFRHSIRTVAWEIPRGFGDRGISANENAKKELEEETGFKDADMKFLGWVTPDTGVMSSRVAVYLAEIIDNKEAENKDKNEVILNYRHVTKDELKKMIINGEIEDGFTLSALALALLHDII